MEDVAAAAAQSYCVVYALDLNSRSVGLDEMNARGGEQFVEIASRLEPLGSLAAESDGVLFNDAAPQVERIFDRIVGTSQDYYLVGFAPSAAALADRGRYSRIRVSVKRPGVRVSTRTGYTLGEASNPAPAAGHPSRPRWPLRSPSRACRSSTPRMRSRGRRPIRSVSF